MPHIFVETNWLFAYAAPAHHQVPAAADLLERALRGEFTLHLPNVCLGEARQAIRSKCQPRSEATAIRQFLSWAAPAGKVTPDDAAATRIVVEKFESSIKSELKKLDHSLKILTGLTNVTYLRLDDAMLDQATDLALAGIAPKPFDHAILAGILVAAERLWEQGERGISFCEVDSDLQPWGRDGSDRPELREAYDRSHVRVYGDFTLAQPERPADFE